MIYGSVQNLTFWNPGVPSSSELINPDDEDTARVWNIKLSWFQKTGTTGGNT
jgi:hypothetical protein